MESLLGHREPKLGKTPLRLAFQLTGSEATDFLLTLSAGGAWLGALLGGRAEELDHTSQLLTNKIPQGQVLQALEAKMNSGLGRAWV